MLTREEVLKVAKLSKLEFTEEELLKIENDLNDIFKYIEVINEVNVENVEPLYNVLELERSLREDEVDNSLSKKDFLENTYDKDNDFVITPKIVE